MLKKIFQFIIIIIFIAFFTPQISFAVGFDEYVYNLIIPLNDVVPVLLGIAVVVFIWGVIKYMVTSEDPAKKEGAKRVLVIGVIGIFILVSVWGFVSIILTIFFGGNPSGSSIYIEPPAPRIDDGI